MTRPMIRLWSVAGSSESLLKRLGVSSFQNVVELAQQAVGPSYSVRADLRLMSPAINEQRGGRYDDARRIREIEQTLADDQICAVVSLRGGAWLTRLLPHIRFDLLRKRRNPLFLFGFSELTTIINITGRYPIVRAFYDEGASIALKKVQNPRTAFRRCLTDIVEIIEGRPCRRKLHGQLVQGRIPSPRSIRVVGGCLSVLVSLCGSRLFSASDCRRKWIALEDIDEPIYRLDRFLAQLKLAGWLDACDGLLLGDFHNSDSPDQTKAVMELLKYHLPTRRKIPIIAHCNFGHRSSVGPLPINQPIRLIRAPNSAPYPDQGVQFVLAF